MLFDFCINETLIGLNLQINRYLRANIFYTNLSRSRSPQYLILAVEQENISNKSSSVSND